LAVESWRTVGRRIACSFGSHKSFKPEKIIIGGGMADAGEVLFKAIRDTVDKRALPVSKGAVKIVKAKLATMQA